MNVHPIFTHFPVALMTLYAIMEMIRFKRILALPYWFYVKATFCILGTTISYATYLTGDMLENLYEGELIQRHSQSAIVTIVFFTLLSLAHLTRWLELSGLLKEPRMRLARFALLAYTGFVFKTPVIVLCALFGLAAITVTGALGGALAYGYEADPVVNIIYRIFVGI